MMSRPLPKSMPVVLLLLGWASFSMGAEPAFSPENLASLSWHELECIYRQAEPGAIPHGFARDASSIVRVCHWRASKAT